jgi:hypothetical protein
VAGRAASLFRESNMNNLFAMLAVMTLSTAALAQEEMTQWVAKEGVTPMMVSFADLKWTELPERKGMQFAVLSGDKKGKYTQTQRPALFFLRHNRISLFPNPTR